MTRPNATAPVPIRVTTAAPTSAAEASANSTNPATSSGPITKTTSKRVVSAASAVLRRCARPVAGAVRSFQAPRIAAVSGGYVAPARPAAR